jgi:hypothetical protein
MEQQIHDACGAVVREPLSAGPGATGIRFTMSSRRNWSIPGNPPSTLSAPSRDTRSAEALQPERRPHANPLDHSLVEYEALRFLARTTIGALDY